MSKATAQQSVTQNAKPSPAVTSAQPVGGDLSTLPGGIFSPFRMGQTPPDPTNRAMRQTAVLQMQRQAGNHAVQQWLGKTAVQRQAGAPPAQGGGSKHSFTYALPLGEKTLGLAKAKTSVSNQVSVETYANAPAQDAPAQTRSGVSIAADDKGLSVGWQRETEAKIAEKVKGYDIKLKGVEELSSKGGALATELSFEGKPVSVSFKFILIGKDWDEKGIKFLNMDTKFSFEKWFNIPPFEYPAGSNQMMKIGFQPAFTISLEPNWLEIGRRIAERFGEQAVVELGLAGALVAGGVLTIAVAVFEMGMGAEISDRTEQAYNQVKNYARAYEKVMRGQSPPGGPGADEGAAKAQAILAEKKEKVPEAVLIEKAKERDLYGEATSKAKPAIRRQAIKAYWDEHWFEAAVYGEEGANYKLFIRVLDAKLSNV